MIEKIIETYVNIEDNGKFSCIDSFCTLDLVY